MKPVECAARSSRRCSGKLKFAGAVPRPLVTTVPYSNSAGLGDIRRGAANLSSGQSATVSLSVSGAVVTTPGANEFVDVYVQDGGAAIKLRPAGGFGLLEALEPGDRVNFSVTEVSNINGQPVVTRLTNMNVLASGVSVYIREETGSTFDEGDDAQLVHVFGPISQVVGLCGNDAICYQLSHGNETFPLRVPTTLGLALGDCVDVYAPLTIGSPARLDMINTDWIRTYEP